ncbi:MAG: zinc ribbon domain-containing protein [Anaerolineaceae bacterium]|nr:zinc ribbon domain-containing protein [Anaerolineaceae bacterium]
MDQQRGNEIVYKVCPNCGHMNRENVEVCSACGVNILGFVQNSGEIQILEFGVKGRDQSPRNILEGMNENSATLKGAVLQIWQTLKKFSLVILFVLIIAVLGSVTLGKVSKQRQEKAQFYYVQAMEYLEHDEFQSALFSAEKARRFGYNIEEVSLLKSSALKKLTIQAYFSGDQRLTREYAMQCLDINPANHLCSILFWKSERHQITAMQEAGNWAALFDLLNNNLSYYPDYSGMEALHEEAYQALRQDLLFEKKYLIAFYVLLQKKFGN